jgi:hypothetical protein
MYWKSELSMWIIICVSWYIFTFRRLLTHKLSNYGISGNILKWITYFLTDRKQKVNVNGISSTGDCDLMQADIDALEEWSQKWLLKFHTQKCKVMHIGKGHPEYNERADKSCYPLEYNKTREGPRYLCRSSSDIQGPCKQDRVEGKPDH